MAERIFTARSPGKPRARRWTVKAGRVARVEAADPNTPAEDWLLPPLLDVQINGYAGVDYQAADLTQEQLLRAVRGLRRAGCTRFLPALITDRWEALLGKLRHLRQLRLASAELRSAIVGWHIEGPFLSSEPGFHGAHDPALMLDPTPEHIHALREAAGEDLLLLTLAPGREGAIPAITLATSLGMKVSLGHTNASAATLRAAVAAGATGFTHLANACPQLLDRHDNILWRVMDTPGLTVSLIADTRHVSPALFRLVHRLLPGDKIIYTTDAMSAASAPPGRYRLGTLEMAVGDDRIVRQPGQTNFAGSALTPVEAVFNAADMLGASWLETWERMSVGPARWLGQPTGLAAGQPADFCLVRASADGTLERLRTFCAGEEVE